MFKIQNGFKIYNKCEVLKNINLYFENSRIYGLVGTNGCGKTLILKALSGYIKLDKGNVYQENVKLREKNNYVIDTGILIENPDFISHLSLLENLIELSKMSSVKVDINKWISKYNLEDFKNTKYKNLSLGTKKKMALIQAFMSEPTNLILDEPMNALDEESVAITKKIIREILSEKRGVIVITSHHSQDIEDLCDEVIRIENGEIKDISIKKVLTK